ARADLRRRRTARCALWYQSFCRDYHRGDGQLSGRDGGRIIDGCARGVRWLSLWPGAGQRHRFPRYVDRLGRSAAWSVRHRSTRMKALFASIVIVGALAALPWMAGSYGMSFMIQTFIFIALAYSWNL